MSPPSRSGWGAILGPAAAEACGAALAELAGQPDYPWIELNPDASRYLSLLGAGGERRLETELPEPAAMTRAAVAPCTSGPILTQ